MDLIEHSDYFSTQR